jgi:hypothetical protein
MFSLVAQSSTPFDANWFLSTTAQSAAALVAIIGGFLISRLISLVADKSLLVQNLDELRSRRQVKEMEFERFQKIVSTKTHKWFLDDNLLNIVENRGNSNFAKMVEDFNRLGSDPQDIAEYANTLKAVVTRAFKDIAIVRTETGRLPLTREDMRLEGIRIGSEHDEEIYEIVASLLARPTDVESVFAENDPLAESLSPLQSEAATIADDASTPDIALSRHDAAIKERNRLNEELSVIGGEINLLESRIPGKEQQRRIIQGFAVLAYFSLVGIVYPLYLLSRNPLVAHGSTRSLVLFGFISGFIALLIFIWSAVADLSVMERSVKKAQEPRSKSERRSFGTREEHLFSK